MARVAKYTVVRTTLLALTVVAGVYLAIVVINFGGFIDQIFRSQIDNQLLGIAMGMRDASLEEKARVLDQTQRALEQAYGLNEPFLLRCLRWLSHGLTLDWGNAARLRTLQGFSRDVRDIILERMINTLLLAGTANVLLFFASVFSALYISRKYGSWLDKFMVAISPISSVPNWIHGILLTVIFAAQLRLLPLGGMFDAHPPATPLGYIPIVAKHMVLPLLAIFINTFFQTVYAWRTFFLLDAQDDYVELAEAKGLPPRMIERRYILRPTLPFIITNFALMLISFWQGVIALEVFFAWPGIGALFLEAIRLLDRTVVVGLVVVFAYLLAITVFLLDIIYALVDPRVSVEGNGYTVKAAVRPKRFWQLWRRRRQPPPGRPDWTPAKIIRGLFASFTNALGAAARGLGQALRELRRYPTALFGLAIIGVLMAFAVYAVTTLPYDQAIKLWRGDRSDWYQNPKTAPPVWINLFRRAKLPSTIVLDSRSGAVRKEVAVISDSMRDVSLTFTFDYPYDGFPRDLVLFLAPRYVDKRPHVSLTWLTPDGRKIDVADFSAPNAHTYYLSGDTRLGRRLKGQPPLEALLGDPAAAEPTALKGTYQLLVSGLVFEPEADIEAELILYGQVHGLAGTDHYRRDLTVALLWGAPVALAFGLIGAVSTSLLAMIIAAVGVWFGGQVDNVIQRITEVNIILPSLPIAMTVYFLYGKSIWMILGVIVLLSIFGSAVKNFRAVFIQAKEAPYVEAARAYGASHARIILRYLVPRTLPILIPQLVILIPGYVFMEATLAFLGVSDPHLPTWGKVVYEALVNGVFQGHYYWVLEPIALLLLTGLSFAMVGFALDRIFNPRLRGL